MSHEVIVISHTSAFLFWRAFTGRVSLFRRLTGTEPMTTPVRLTRQLREELARLGWRPSPKRPIDLLASGREYRARVPWVRPHACFDSLPVGAVLQISEHVAVVCPELCFLQVARVFSKEKLVLAGYELCGTYAQVGAALDLREREALTNTGAIREFAAMAPKMRTSAALRLLEYVRDGAASPMEAKATMLLSLPTSWGGYGLPAPQLNPELPTAPDARRLYARATVRPDLFWTDARFDLEYDGRDSHDADDHAKDVARWGALAVMDIDVLMLTAAQIYDAAAFHQLARVVAGKLGRRLRVRREDFPVRVTRLREELGLL